jgi:predicted anti-sigma-YlaC factor YlaD
MRCRTARRYVSLAVDGELDARRSARLEGHLRECEECRALEADLRDVIAAAPALRGPEPSAAVWDRIRAGLTAAERRPARGGLWASPALRYAGAAALALVVVVSGLLIGRRPGGPLDRQNYTLAKLDEAENHYQLAIQALGEAFAAQKGTLAPQVAEMFERNLAVVDATIQACRQAVLDEPDDLQARSFLLAAYMNKVTLLDSALDFQKGSPEAAGKGKIL